MIVSTQINKLSVVILCYIIFTQLDVIAQNNIIGKYIGQESNRTLKLIEDNSFIIRNDENSMVFQLDTLSFGTWKQEKSFIILNTPDEINNNVLKVNVIESVVVSDTLKIKINNPYEKYFHEGKMHRPRYFNYFLQISSDDSTFGPLLFLDENQTHLYKKEKDRIYNIEIFMVPLCFEYPSTLSFNFLKTELYTFKNTSSNCIVIDIPQFTFDYIGYERYREEYVKIKKKDELLLRGELFKKM